MNQLEVTFWGVRGSIPCPGPQTMRYGGNTACIELYVPVQERRIIIDAGSGIRDLAKKILAQDLPRGSLRTEIFLSHTHWDHIMGFPFFIPAYIPKTEIKVFGPVTYELGPLEEVVGGQMRYRYFPVNMGELAAKIEYTRLREDPHIDLGGGLELATKIINHPITALGYRFSCGGRSVVTAYDHEPFRNLFVTDPADPAYDEGMASEGALAAEEQNRAMEEFYAGADLLVHDAQYTMAEYQQGKLGWGHSPIEDVIAAAARAGVKRLALFHHDPDRSDEELDRMSERYCGDAPAEMEVFFAREGMTIAL